MKCEEISLSQTEAVEAYFQLFFENLDDQIPGTVNVSGKPVLVDDAAAKLFIAQFQRSGRSTYILQLFSPCTSNDFDLKIVEIEKDPFLRRFFAMLIQNNGSASIGDFCSAKSFDVEDLSQLVGIAREIESVGVNRNISESDLSFFMQSLQHIIVQDDIYSARTALENMKRKIRYRAEGPNDEIVRPITVRDMACHLLTIASINDYKATLEKNFSPQELARLPENLIEPINLKALLIDGRINSIHQPDLFGPRAQAQYDQRYNTIMFPDTIVPDQLFNYSKNTGLVPSQIINHELQHAFTDWKRKKLTRATNEAEAHFLEVFYAGLKLGFDFAEQSYQNIFDSNSEYNAEAIKRLEKLTGLDGSNFKDMFPDSEISYRYIAVKLARDMITMVRAGNIIQKVSLQKVAESYATSRSIITFLILISKQSNLDEIVAAMSNNRSLRLDAIEIKEMSSGSISIQNSKVVIPAELDRIGIISRRQIMALKQVFDSDPITGYTVWNNVSKHMFLYLLCKYKLDPNFDTWKYVKETLVPFLTLEYTLVQQDPNDMGTK